MMGDRALHPLAARKEHGGAAMRQNVRIVFISCIYASDIRVLQATPRVFHFVNNGNPFTSLPITRPV